MLATGCRREGRANLEDPDSVRVAPGVERQIP